MPKDIPANHSSHYELIWAPAVISLAVTLLRLVGELKHWPEKWFSTATGGIIPQGISWVIGITWLAIPFGIYFGLKLCSRGDLPLGLGKACLYSGIALITILLLPRGLLPLLKLGFPRGLIVIWLTMAVSAAITCRSWTALFKIMLAYGIAARLPVAVIMFYAMRGHWGTHYDYVDMPAQFQMTFWRGYFWLAFFPQLVFWVFYTGLVGTVAGVVAVAIRRLFKPASSEGMVS